MIITSNNDTECTFAKFFLDLISVIDLFLGFIKVISLVVVKSMIVGLDWLLVSREFILTVYFTLNELAHTLMLCI